MADKGIQHMVIFCLKHDKGSFEEKKFLMDGQSILSQIPVVSNFRVLPQISPKNDYHFGFSMEFSDQEAYDTYNQHPLHVDFVDKRWKAEVTKFLEIDFEL